ncbi:efflux RND transporter periplasmic adaptor subunit [Chloroflexota bacterium]
MKKIGIIVILLLSLVLMTVSACSSDSNGQSDSEMVKVERGDLTLIVTGSGNIKALRDAKLSFASAGRVASISVQEGDRVNKGDELARLDTLALELTRNQSQISLDRAQVALAQAKMAEEIAGYNLKETMESKDSLDLALLNSKIAVQTANYNLEQTRDLYTWSDIKIAQANVDDAEDYLKYAIDKLGRYELLPEEGYLEPEEGSPEAEGYKLWQKAVVQAQSRLDTAKANLDAILEGYDIEEVAIKKLQLQAAEMAEEQARKDLDELNDDIAIKELQLQSAQKSTEDAEKAIELAEQSLADVERQLQEATITAPFDGEVADVGTEEGERVTSVDTIIHLIDASVLELVVELDEIDIPGVKIEQKAIIDVDALPDITFAGKIALIYPTPIEEGGVVLYNVKIHLDATDDSGLRIGMSADADIVINERNNILLVPDKAIRQDSKGNQVVKVVVNEQTEERPVVIGISDGFETEIVEGLNEGETVVVER